MMSNVLVIRKADPSTMGNVNMAINSQGVIPQINLSGGQNIPMSGYFGARHDPNLGYTQRPEFAGVKPEGIVEGGNTNFHYNNQSYGGGNAGREAAHQQYGLDREAHEAQPEWNLTAPQRIAGLATGALPAAWSALSALSDDSQGDVFSSLGRAGMGALATRSASSPLERWAVDAAGKRTNTSNASVPTVVSPPQTQTQTMTPKTSIPTQITADWKNPQGGAETEVSSQGGAETEVSSPVADPTNAPANEEARRQTMIQEAAIEAAKTNKIQEQTSMLSAEDSNENVSDATRNAIEGQEKAASEVLGSVATRGKLTPTNSKNADITKPTFGKARAWRYY
jgi:hypothetical protein